MLCLKQFMLKYKEPVFVSEIKNENKSFSDSIICLLLIENYRLLFLRFWSYHICWHLDLRIISLIQKWFTVCIILTFYFFYPPSSTPFLLIKIFFSDNCKALYLYILINMRRSILKLKPSLIPEHLQYWDEGKIIF